MLLYVYDHENELWRFQGEFVSQFSARHTAGFMAYDGWDCLLVNTSNSHFEYFWGV